LGEKLRAEMPPSVPEKILRSRGETADRRSFQVWMKHVDDDERSGHLSALLNDPKRIPAM
jgi:hypothetical protein